MKIPTLDRIVKRAKSVLRRDDNRFLQHAHGVIHVGANSGQERDVYRKYQQPVVWIEPIAEVFATLTRNLRDYPQQRAFRYLITDKENETYSFHIANNNGASSSILDLKLHKDIWPGVKFEKTISLTSTTLPTMLAKENLRPADYDALVMDTQGSELLVLQGARPILDGFRFIKTEAPDFEAYAGCCMVAELTDFLSVEGFREMSRSKFAEHAGGGSYFDVVYQRT